ncbi:putative methyltransferase C9orf114 [Tigriopus californicus]|uniref:putative methyltransferase C9orf114 n=1 Tax=Tigriopus californicus TaxID=6832 RepID=UPI0027D9FAEE|nr:putative methyltransferase C9orf114 [Tigriopus californicus]
MDLADPFDLDHAAATGARAVPQGLDEPPASPDRPVSDGLAIRQRKERKKRKQDKLLAQLERKRQKADHVQSVFQVQRQLITAAPGTPAAGRGYTVSLALAGSILDNAQSPELRTYLAGQVARALAVFNVDEIVVFEDERPAGPALGAHTTAGEFHGIGKRGRGQGCVQLGRILQFLECPQYLRKHFFPIHQDLKYAGVLNPTDMPHHLRASENSSFREGVVLDRPPTKNGSLVNVGLSQEVVIDKTLKPGIRVTVHLVDAQRTTHDRTLVGKVVSPSFPRTHAGLYWGYNVRLAQSLTEVFQGGPYKGGYDLTIGTSERGDSVDEFAFAQPFKHLLIVLGGVKGLEVAVDTDKKIQSHDPATLFDHYLNTCPLQGSRTIRTEEALLITLASLRPKIVSVQAKCTL